MAEAVHHRVGIVHSDPGAVPHPVHLHHGAVRHGFRRQVQADRVRHRSPGDGEHGIGGDHLPQSVRGGLGGPRVPLLHRDPLLERDD